jgi:hypothetical protein
MADRDSLYRPEALEYRQRSVREGGDVLRLGPAWGRWGYWLLLAGVACGLLAVERLFS